MSAEPRHILLLAPPFEARGFSAYTLRLARGLPGLRYSAAVVTSCASSLDAVSRSQITLNEWRFSHLPILADIQAFRHAQSVFQPSPHLIHVQHPRMLRLGTILARKLHVPYVLTVHHLGTSGRLSIDPLWCRKVIAASDAVAEELVTQSDIPPAMISVIHPGVEPFSGAELPIPLKAGHVPVIGTAGPLEPDKGLAWFLGAAHQVLAILPQVEFVIAGSGSEEANLRRMARELGISSKITFAPYLFDFHLSLSAMDMFVHPAVRKGLSSIMLEAMELGLPIVASQVGGIGDVIVDKENGLLVPPKQLEPLAKAILRLLNDPHFARQIGSNGRQRVRQAFSIERMLTLTTEIYDEVITTAGRTAA